MIGITEKGGPLQLRINGRANGAIPTSSVSLHRHPKIYCIKPGFPGKTKRQHGRANSSDSCVFSCTPA
jgi:hypothetical protein